MGTQGGARLLTGESGFLIAEGEWARLIGELGPLIGLAMIAIRIGVIAGAVGPSLRHLRKGDPLPWLLLGAAALTVPQGQWGQPTSLGFAVIAGGLLLASCANPLKRMGQAHENATAR